MEQTLKTRSLSKAVGLGIALLIADSSAQAYELYADDDTKVTRQLPGGLRDVQQSQELRRHHRSVPAGAKVLSSMD